MTPHILVVDDDRAGLQAIREALALRLCGARIDTCESGGSALERVRQEAYHLVISDWRMPGLDGLQFLQETKKLKPELPCILITGHGDVCHAALAEPLGLLDILLKPLDRGALLTSVKRALALTDAR